MEETKIRVSIKHEIEENSIKREFDNPDANIDNVYSDVKFEVKLEKTTDSRTKAEIFYCDECKKKYKKLDYLEIHKAEHSPLKYCPVCDAIICVNKKEFTYHLNQHIQEKTKEEKLKIYTCEYCQKQFNKKKPYVEHIRVHTNERPYKCNICGNGFKQRGALKDHQVTHTKEKQHICKVCNGSFTTSSGLKRHEKNTHVKGKSYSCKHCGEMFINLTHYKTHRKTTHPELSYKQKCPDCSEIFQSKYMYRKHRETHESSRTFSKNYTTCGLCGEINLNVKAFFDHKRNHLHYTQKELDEAIRNKNFKCKLCCRCYNTKESLFRHVDFHEKRETKCNVCQEFYTVRGYKSHMRTIHRNLHCKVCFKVITGRRRLYTHYDRSHPNIRKKYSCKTCMKQYMTNASLELHIQSHMTNNIKNLKCSVCGTRFRTYANLNSHMYKFHKMKGRYTRRELNCTRCAKIFTTVHLFKAHSRQCRQNCSKKQMQEISVSDTKCDICGKVFTTRDIMRRHRKSHLNMTYNCRFCDKKFKAIRTMRTHIRQIHPDKKCYFCDKCNIGFRTYRDLFIHGHHHSNILKTEPELEMCEYAESVQVKEEPC